MGLVGRSAEIGELAALLDRAGTGFGGVITLVGTAGSGKSALTAEAAALARDRGFEVAGGSPVRGRPGRLVWAGLLGSPVLAGHSQSGGFASVYAARYPASGVINVDAPPDLGTFIALLRAVVDQNHGDMLGTWAMEQGLRVDLLPPETAELVTRSSRPRRELLASYWEDLLAMAPDRASAMVDGVLAAITAAKVPYLLVLGTEMSPDTAGWFGKAALHAVTEVWAGSGHFPHLAHPARFAERLAAMA